MTNYDTVNRAIRTYIVVAVGNAALYWLRVLFDGYTDWVAMALAVALFPLFPALLSFVWAELEDAKRIPDTR